VLSKNVLKKADSFYPNYVGTKKLTIIITPEKKRQEEDELNYHMQQTKNNLLKKKKQAQDINQNPWEKKIKQT
jgi:hypothetical protein